MPSIEIAKREWQVRVILADDETETILKRFTSIVRYRPEVITVTVIDFGDGPELSGVGLSGRRVLKDGARGDLAAEFLHGSEITTLTMLLKDVVQAAWDLVKEEVNGAEHATA